MTKTPWTLVEILENNVLTWEDLFQSRIETKNRNYLISKLTELQCEDVLKTLSFGLQDYATKSKFSKFSVALSGGIDSVPGSQPVISLFIER